MRRTLFSILALTALTILAPAALAAPRVSIDNFVGYDALRDPVMSPNGATVAAIRHNAIGDVLVAIDLATGKMKALQVAKAAEHLEIEFVEFKGDDRLIFGFQQKIRVVPGTGTVNRIKTVDDGFDTVSRVFASNIDGSGLISLYDPSGQADLPRTINAQIVNILPDDKDSILIVAPKYGGAGLWKVNVHTGRHVEIERGSLNTFNWVVDREGTPVLRQDVIAGGRGYAWLRRGLGQKSWTEIARFRGAEGANSGPTFQGVGPAVKAGQVFVLARRESEDKSGLYVFDAATGDYAETVQTSNDFDVSAAIRDLKHNSVLAACWWAYRWTCEAKDPTFAKIWTGLSHAVGDQVNLRLVSRGGDDDSRWILKTNGPQDLGTFYIYDLKTHQLSTLFQARPTVDPAQLPTERVIDYVTSDGQKMWGYLWLPPGVKDAKALPTIIVPHGGPEGRDVWGFDPFAMTFASQGYAVFQPNFRGGGGSGRKFVEAGHRQWGQRMQEDVADGARNLIKLGIADPARLCITGWSYGGYVAFTAAFKNTDLYKCSVAGAGISDLIEMQNWVRNGSQENDVVTGGGGGMQSVSYKYWATAIGDPERDKAMMNANSAARNAERVTMPLLIVHGDEDQTVPIEQSQIMMREMQRVGRPVKMVTLPDTSHYYTADQGDAWRTALQAMLDFYGKNIGPGVTAPN